MRGSKVPSKACLTKRQHDWSPQNDAIMLALIEAKINWRTIAILMDRPHTTCYTRYLKTVRPALENGWVPPQIKDHIQLRAMIDKAQREAAEALSNRFKVGAISDKSAKRTTWSKQMDQTILDMMEGGKQWQEIGETLGRPYSSCYTRYYTVLDPFLKNAWTPDKIEMLNKLAKAGTAWKLIGKELGIRPLACKSKWADLGKTAAEGTTTTASDPATSEMLGTKVESPGSTEPAQKIRTVAFSRDESRIILDLVETYGHEDKWDTILYKFKEKLTALATQRARVSYLTTKRIEAITSENLRHQFLRLLRSKVLWTFDQETSLIQQVLRLGTDDDKWAEIAERTGFHSPEACRSHWKQLDMPVNATLTRWSKIEQANFWSLWLRYGSDFEGLAKAHSVRTAIECQEFFEKATRDFNHDNPTQFRGQVQGLLVDLLDGRQKFTFSKEQSQKLQRAMRFYSQKVGHNSTQPGTWRWIANKVQRGLSPATCVEHWTYLRQNMDVIYGPLEEGKSAIVPHKSSSWSHDELKLLDQGIRELGSAWSDIHQRYLPWRTTRAIRQRWLLMSDRSAKVTVDEYYTILKAGERVEDIDWNQLVQDMPGWNKLPCRRVFECSYKHLVQTTVWTPDEDRLLVEKTLEEHGRDWNAIAAHFTGIQPARAPLYTPTKEQSESESKGHESMLKTHKTAWQCRLRWCQLVQPLMPKYPSLTATENSRSVALKLSKQLLTSRSLLTATQ
ncbi:hypothetical protein BG004_004312 [Podila humilis]|nr:hypothetical protein BG004_004312 [Podila humilis]